MSEKQEKVSYKKETYIVLLTWFVPWLFGKVEGWLGETEWRVPAWVQQFAAWFGKDAPISNALLLSLVACLVYGMWLVARLYRGSNHAIASWKAEVAQLEGSIDSARNTYATQQAVQGRLQLELVGVREKLTRSERELDAKEQELVATKAKATIHAAAAATIAELQAENSVLKKELADQQLKARYSKPAVVASVAETYKLEKDYKEVSLDGIHWRWSYLPPYNQVTNMKAYCDHCDYVLELGAAGYGEDGYLCLCCPKCGTRVRMPSALPETNVEKATAEIERRIRNGLWVGDLATNKARAEDILHNIERHSPVYKRAV